MSSEKFKPEPINLATNSLASIAVSITVWALALLEVGAVIYFLLTGGANEKFSEFPLIVNSHVLLGAVYLLMAPLQFSKALRTRSLDFHRWSGRFLVSFGLIAGASAFLWKSSFLTQAHPSN
jgi:hypothetical protein